MDVFFFERVLFTKNENVGVISISLIRVRVGWRAKKKKIFALIYSISYENTFYFYFDRFIWFHDVLYKSFTCYIFK
jgi:hypothetical protein